MEYGYKINGNKYTCWRTFMGIWKIRGEISSSADISRTKIKVFISSICSVDKYDKVRAELKKAIEDTQLADVYTFEGKGASILPAGAHR